MFFNRKDSKNVFIPDSGKFRFLTSGVLLKTISISKTSTEFSTSLKFGFYNFISYNPGLLRF